MGVTTIVSGSSSCKIYDVCRDSNDIPYVLVWDGVAAELRVYKGNSTVPSSWSYATVGDGTVRSTGGRRGLARMLIDTYSTTEYIWVVRVDGGNDLVCDRSTISAFSFPSGNTVDIDNSSTQMDWSNLGFAYGESRLMVHYSYDSGTNARLAHSTNGGTSWATLVETWETSAACNYVTGVVWNGSYWFLISNADTADQDDVYLKRWSSGSGLQRWTGSIWTSATASDQGSEIGAWMFNRVPHAAASSNIIVFCGGNYNSSGAIIYSRNGGQTWTDISGMGYQNYAGFPSFCLKTESGEADDILCFASNYDSDLNDINIKPYDYSGNTQGVWSLLLDSGDTNDTIEFFAGLLQEQNGYIDFAYLFYDSTASTYYVRFYQFYNTNSPQTRNALYRRTSGDWTSEENLLGAHDGVCMSTTAKNDVSGEFSFDFNVPTGRTIDGIEVKIHAICGDTDDFFTVELYDSTSTWRAKTTSAPGSGSVCGDCVDLTVGGSSDIWGGTWTPAHISGDAFRLRIESEALAAAGGYWAVDYVEVTVYFSSGATPQTKTYEADVYLQKAFTKTYDADVYLQKAFTKTYDADVYLQKAFTQTYDADVYLQKAFTQTYEADILLQGSATKTYEADVYLQKTFTQTYTADLILVLVQTKTYTADVYLQKGFTKDYTADVLLQGSTTKTYTADVYLQKAFTQTYDADVYLQKAFTKTYDADVYLQKALTKTYDADVLLQGSTTKTYQADVYLQKGFTKTYQADVILQTLGVQTRTKTYTVDVILWKRGTLFSRGSSLYTQKDPIFTRN